MKYNKHEIHKLKIKVMVLKDDIKIYTKIMDEYNYIYTNSERKDILNAIDILKQRIIDTEELIEEIKENLDDN